MKAKNPGIYKWAQKVAHKVAIKNKKAFQRGSWIFSDYINMIGDFDTEEMELERQAVGNGVRSYKRNK
ncbi:hypothetical protein M0R72_00015 [Candidatus Pacearchaeota archaeon]|jgi:hypothetical protein|nr:hypothetical protein [Candidatus Pacearchaeota archaeon]